VGNVGYVYVYTLYDYICMNIYGIRSLTIAKTNEDGEWELMGRIFICVYEYMCMRRFPYLYTYVYLYELLCIYV
jgi:hypothetical protein